MGRLRALGLPIALLLLAMVSISTGAALAKGLFASVGPAGATLLRLTIASLILVPLFRAWRLDGAGPRGALLGYGAALGFMNLFYYLALQRVPMGLVVAIEFLGPLAVAVYASHRRVDYVWAGLAALGLALLLPWRPGASSLDPLGLLFALLAGVGWALYIVFGTRAGSVHGGRRVAIGMVIASACVLPVGVAEAGGRLLDASILPLAAVVAVLSSAVPYSLEMYALQRVPTRTFGIFMSVEPALAALAGLALLGERLTVMQWLAIACVMAASFGSAATSGGPAPAREDRHARPGG